MHTRKNKLSEIKRSRLSLVNIGACIDQLNMEKNVKCDMPAVLSPFLF